MTSMPLARYHDSNTDHDPPRSAFETFYLAAHRRAWLTARRVGGPHLADELISEAFLRIYQRWPTRWRRTFDDNLRYLQRIVTNLALDAHRRGRRIRIVPWPEGFEPASDDLRLDEALTRLDLHDQHTHIRALIDGMSVQMRVIAELRFHVGLNATEIAAELGITPSAVRTVVQRIRAQLARHVAAASHNETGGTR